MTVKRNIYLNMKTLEQAKDILFTSFPLSSCLKKETVPVKTAVGRVLAKAVFARISSPPFHAAAMDGIAIKASDTYGASENNPIELIDKKNAFQFPAIVLFSQVFQVRSEFCASPCNDHSRIIPVCPDFFHGKKDSRYVFMAAVLAHV